MSLKFNVNFYKNFFYNLNFGIFKKIFFLISLSYFCVYFLENIDKLDFKIDLASNGYNLAISFFFCILSVCFNAAAWQNIVFWFGKKKTKKNLISFYLLTNILKYVPGGIWHFFERFNFLKDITNPQLAFYSTLIEPYFMLCSSFLLVSLGIVFSPFYILFVIPTIFLNRKLIYFILSNLEVLKSKTIIALKIKNTNYEFQKRIKLSSFFPFKAFLIEILFVLSKFIGFSYCFHIFRLDANYSYINLLVVFSLSWAIGLIVPTAPGGVGVFEACFVFFIGKNIPQNVVLSGLVYFRLISTASDILLSLPFLFRKVLGRN